jgi:putative transposase
MTNHVHLLLTTDNAAGCALLMKGIAQLYAQYFNKTYERTGYLWEGRFRSCLVQSEAYVLACYRYIEMNPVRAGLVRRADAYPFSSYCANAKGDVAELLTPHEEYLRLGVSEGERQAVYRDLFGTLLSVDQLEEIRTATNGGYALGSPDFRHSFTRHRSPSGERNCGPACA